MNHLNSSSQQSSSQQSNGRLAEIIKQLSSPLDPIATGETAKLPKLQDIRAVIFDIYGTLLISASGDISLASGGSRGKAALDALAATSLTHQSDLEGNSVVEQLHAAIAKQHQNSSSNHPEVEIRECWDKVLSEQGIKADESQIEQLAIEYECRVNPIWPMPGLAEMLGELTSRKLQLGIVSNAQFFTPLAFKPLTNKDLSEWGFTYSLNIWSYEHREAKPGVVLYELCAQRLAAEGISPEQILYVGNDLRNDVWPAGLVGFKTALYAGDARSLRWRADDAAVAGVQPDAVLTDLKQISQLLDG